MRIFVDPELLHPERDAKLCNKEKSAKVSTSLVQIPNNSHLDRKTDNGYRTSNYNRTSNYIRTFTSYDYTADKTYQKYSKPSPTYKHLTRFEFKKIKDITICSWVSPKQNYSYFTISMMLPAEFSYSTTLERFVINMSYSKSDDYWTIKISHNKKSSNSSSDDLIVERFAEDVPAMIKEIKGFLLYKAIDPKQVYDLALQSLQELEIIYNNKGNIDLVRTNNYSGMEDLLNKPISYSVQTSTPTDAAGSYHKYNSDDDGWKRWAGYG